LEEAIPLLALPRGGVAASSIECREASESTQPDI
jgi:hypothetical protein